MYCAKRPLYIKRVSAKGPMDKAKGGQDRGWEVGMAGVGGSAGGKMEITALEQQLKKGKKNYGFNIFMFKEKY